MRRVARVLVVLLVLLLAPVTAVELGCRGPVAGLDPAAPYASLAPAPADRRPEARTWLTYPEWHIVYSAEALGRWLKAGGRPSGYPYWRDVRGFWSGYCALNQVSRGMEGAGSARLMIHVIGLSFTVELLVKALYENTIGRLSEAIGGWASRDDAYAARVQATYGAFMRETPWYRFPFATAFSRLWAIEGAGVRHWERRAALSAEYGVKAVYAKALGSAGNATLGPDEVRLRFVATGPVAGEDVRRVRRLGDGAAVWDAPRYARFTTLVAGLATRKVELVEIAGNDDVFATFLAPADMRREWPGAATLLAIPLPDGRVRLGLTAKVPDLLPLVRGVSAQGGRLEHVYDY